MLTKKYLNLAGWLAVVSAVITFPGIILSIISGMVQVKSASLLYLEAIFNTGTTALTVFIFIMLKRLLNEKAKFHDVDKYITFLIWVTIILTVIEVLTLPFSEIQGIIGLGVIVLIIPLGIIYIVFGIKLLNCEDNLFGYLKPFSYLSIATGIMMAVVILIPLGMITSIISDIVLALIFFKAVKNIQVS